ncbi:MAG: hypothetical protein ACREF4_04680 [Gammaproteobacteria bacterium]
MMLEFDQSPCWQGEEFTVRLLARLSAARARCERELQQSRVPLPLPHRMVWAELSDSPGTGFVSVEDRQGRCRWGFALQVDRSRALPFHFILRVPKLSGPESQAVQEAGLRALAELARRRPRVLRVELDAFSPDAPLRASVGATLTALGFRSRTPTRLYTDTVRLDLSQTEAVLFTSLHPTARRHVRAAGKHGMVVRPVDDARYVARMRALVSQTQARTGMRLEIQDWHRLIEFSHRYPAFARVAGLFRSGDPSPGALLAFAVGYVHGDHAEYAAAASARGENVRLPLGYGPAWDLICWARGAGASWFDFGGVTPGSHGDPDDLRGGISDFKRFFGTTVIRVREEWVLEPHRRRAQIATAVSNLAARLSRIGERIGRNGAR